MKWVIQVGTTVFGLKRLAAFPAQPVSASWTVIADALTHTYAVRINVENSDRKLLPGMVANVQLGTAEGKSVAIPTLPVTSVQKRADGSLFVWVISSDNTAHRKAVTVGQTMGTRIAITQGIADGERVVTEGYQKLSEGTKVDFQ